MVGGEPWQKPSELLVLDPLWLPVARQPSDEGDKEKREQMQGGQPGSMCHRHGITPSTPHCTCGGGRWTPTHEDQRCSLPKPWPDSGPDEIHAQVAGAPRPMCGPRWTVAGQGRGRGPRRHPSRQGWPGRVGGWQGGVFWVRGKARTSPGAAASRPAPGCREEAQQRSGGLTVGPGIPATPPRPEVPPQSCPRGQPDS